MNIFNRPPAISEDTLEYVLHPGSTFSDRCSVTTLSAIIDSHVQSVLPNHIWHKDAFELKVVSTPQNEDKWTIEGRMRVGDCVDDEWCVVWLLRDISRRWDVVVSVFDSDGEFLLIEAAHHLPAWVTPTNAENRVWIYEGHLHLVPLQYVSSPATKHDRRRLPSGSQSDDEDTKVMKNSDDYISISDAIHAVRNPDWSTLAPPELENAAMRRTEGYPALARQHLHRTKAYLPRDIVIALSNNPALVQKAIETFYTRDAIQLRAATRMSRFPPSSSILTMVTMTRAAYAQLVGQRFKPPNIFGRWKETEGTLEWKWKDTGMKIACGFEMLYQESKSRQDAITSRIGDISSSVDARKDALRRDPEYMTYIRRLEDIDYFKDEAEGSAAWKEHENRAAAQFISSKQADDANRTSFAALVNLAISQGKDVPIHLANGEEDSEEWLAVDESTIDEMLVDSVVSQTSTQARGHVMSLNERNGRETSEENLADQQTGQLRSLAEKVEDFVEGRGNIEGAMFDDDQFSEDDEMSQLTDSDDGSTSDPRSDKAKLAANADRQTAMDKLVPALEPSEYGKMPPSFHSNSQRVKKVATETEVAPVEGRLSQDPGPPPRSVRPLIFPRDKFDGVEDSDDESEEESVSEDADEDREEQPTLVGEIEVDMQQEEEEFLEFSREALGITPDIWNDIVQDRKERGAFLPASALRDDSTYKRKSSPPHLPAITDPCSRLTESSGANPRLESFEAVMQAMDAELSRAKQAKHAVPVNPPPKQHEDSKRKGKQKMEENEGDIDMGMDSELRAAVQNESDDDSQEGEEASEDYTVIKNFLESFKGQLGLSGPVSNLVGRLQPGWKLPKDES